MSVDTRTSGFDDQPALSMVKVPCDPAQVIVNHASFRVRLAPSPSARSKPANAPGRVPVLGGAVVAAAAGAGRRRAPVVWSGKSAPGDTAAMGGLLQAVREHGRGHGGFDDGDGGATQTIPASTSPTTWPRTRWPRRPSSASARTETRTRPVRWPPYATSRTTPGTADRTTASTAGPAPTPAAPPPTPAGRPRTTPAAG